MKKTTLMLALVLLPTLLWAQSVSQNEALQIAERFFAQQSSSTNAQTRREAKVEEMSVSYTATKEGGNAALYVINRGSDDGFVVVSGSANTDYPVLGWSDKGAFDYDKAPVQLKDLLASYSQAKPRRSAATQASVEGLVEMADGSQTWIGKAIITAGQAILEYAGTDWAGGFVPGETVTFVANFKNVGHYMATNAIATIACESEYVTLLNPTIEIGTIDPEGIGTCVFNVQIDAACPETEQIIVRFTMQADGDLTAEGSITMKNACNVIFELSDSYGDGWNGARLTVGFSDGTPAQELTLTSGSAGTYNIEISNGVHVTLTWTSGSWDSECSFVVKYDNGDVIYNCSSVHAGLLYEFDCNCGGGQPLGSFNPVENLAAEVGIGTITLTWDEPEGAINYIISRNGIEIAQTTEPTYVDELFTEIFYTYCVVAEYSDGVSAPECIVVKSELGVEESETEFSVYPNPVNNILFINGGNAEYSYEMYNGMGQVVTKGIAKGTEQISVDGMTKGVYFLRLTSGTQVHMEKVVVK